jgi:hypothetical protein
MSNALPLRLPQLGGRFLGSWCVFLAFLAGWAAIRGRPDEARIPFVALAAFSAGAVVGALRDLSDLQPPGRRAIYVGILLAVVAATSLLALRTSRSAREVG